MSAHPRYVHVERYDEWVARYETGETLSAIGRKYGTAPSNVRRALQSRGVTIRPQPTHDLPPIEAIDVPWLAGLLEGEGSFTARVQRGGSRCACVTLAMTDRDVVERFARLVDRKCQTTDPPSRRRAGWNPIYRVEVGGQPAVQLMRLIRPWMGERRTAKIDELVATYGRS